MKVLLYAFRRNTLQIYTGLETAKVM